MKPDTNRSKSKFIPSHYYDTSITTPQNHASLLRNEIINSQNDEQKLMGILLPAIKKNNNQDQPIEEQSLDSITTPRLTSFLKKKIDEVKETAQEEDRKIKKSQEFSFKLNHPYYFSQRQLQNDNTQLMSPHSILSYYSKDQTIQKGYQQPSLKNKKTKYLHLENNQNYLHHNHNHHLNIQHDIDSISHREYSQSASPKPEQLTQSNITNLLEVEEPSKLIYLTTRLDKIYRKHSLNQINQEFLQRQVKEKYQKYTEAVTYEYQQLDLKQFKKLYYNGLENVLKDNHEEQDRKKLTLFELHKTKYLKHWKDQPILIGHKKIEERYQLPSNNAYQNKMFSKYQQEDIFKMKQLFYQRS